MNLQEKRRASSTSISKTERKILIVEDERTIASLVEIVLERVGYRCKTVEDGMSGLKAVEEFKPNLIVLNVMLPDISGTELCRQIRERHPADIGIIFLTAKGHVADRIIGFDAGGDSYLSKPFEPPELVAIVKNTFERIEAIKQAKQKTWLSSKCLDIDLIERKAWVKCGGEKSQLNLTQLEFDVLVLFAQNPKQIMSREDIASEIDAWKAPGNIRYVDSCISKIRKKIQKVCNSEFAPIETIARRGYRLADPLEC